jgi:NAD(P)-dependent dehydrogenase (short-subunit alcohol dehydrogenase family)
VEVNMEYKGFDKNFSLEGRVALVTGAAQGIGRAIAELFAEKGANIVLVDINASTETAVVVKGFGRELLELQADLTKSSDIASVVEAAMKRFGRIDILSNTAGVVHLDDAENLSEAMWDQTMAVNLKAVFMLAQAVGRTMIKNGGGTIINMASQASVVALDNHVAYCASKAAVVSVTKNLAMEWGQFNITVNAISPTVVLTELGKKAWAGEVGEAMKKLIPVGRFGVPEEIAAAALFLASDAARLITGENLIIDGGYTIK